MDMKAAIKKLMGLDIKTTADLDAYINVHPQIDRHHRPYLMSRCEALTKLVGEQAADSILHELMVQQCF